MLVVSSDAVIRVSVFFFQAEDGIRDVAVTGVQTCALPISANSWKYGSSVLGSAGNHDHEELNCAFSVLAVAMALKMATSLDPTYTTRLDRPGAIPSA